MECFRQWLDILLPRKNKDALVDWSNLPENQVDWSDLPENILWLIRQKLLIYIKDYIQCGAVCRSWRPVYIGGRHPSHHHQLPLLMLPNKGDTNTYSIYNLTAKRVCSFQVPLDHKLFCPGSTYGWLVTVSPSHEVSLVNPFQLPPHNKIELPAVTTFELNIPYGIGEVERDGCFFFIQKLVLSANPASTQNFIAMAIFRASNRLAFCKPGDKSWTSIPCEDADLGVSFSREYVTHDLPAFDTIYYKDKFHVLDQYGHVFAWDVNPPSPSVRKVAPGLEYVLGINRYLLELSGDLVQVVRFTKRVTKHATGPVLKYSNTGFHVHKFDPTCCEWVRMENLQGHALFLGQNQSFALLASDFPGCKPNSIYFTDDFYIFWETNVPHDMGVFNMEDNRTTPLGEKKSKIITASRSKVKTAAPIWIEPMLQ